MVVRQRNRLKGNMAASEVHISAISANTCHIDAYTAVNPVHLLVWLFDERDEINALTAEDSYSVAQN